MKELELNTMMGVIADPIKNVYKIKTTNDLQVIRDIIKVFTLSNAQKNKHAMFSIKNMATFKLVLSNN